MRQSGQSSRAGARPIPPVNQTSPSNTPANRSCHPAPGVLPPPAHAGRPAPAPHPAPAPDTPARKTRARMAWLRMMQTGIRPHAQKGGTRPPGGLVFAAGKKMRPERSTSLNDTIPTQPVPECERVNGPQAGTRARPVRAARPKSARPPRESPVRRRRNRSCAGYASTRSPAARCGPPRGPPA